MGMSFKDAIKRMHSRDSRHYFFFCEQGADGKPLMLADTNRFDVKKDPHVAAALATARVKTHITGAMNLKGTTLVLRPQGTSVSASKLTKAVGAICLRISVGALVEDVSIGEPEADELREKEKGSEYTDEDRQMAFRNPKDPGNTRWVTEYAVDPATSRATVQDGRLLDAAQKPVDGKKGYVVDPATGKLHLFEGGVDVQNLATGQRHKDPAPKLKSLKEGERFVATHHSTPLAGKPVAGAGEIKAKDGRITKINDKSGHYKPEGDLTHQTVRALKTQGARLIDDEVVAAGADGEAQAATPEQRQQFALVEAVRRKYGLDATKSLDELLKGKRARALQDRTPVPEDLVEAVDVERTLRRAGVGPRQKEAQVVLGGKGLTAEEFEKVKGDRGRINQILLQRFGARDVLTDEDDDDLLTSLVKLNKHLRDRRDKLKLGAGSFLETRGNEKAIRQKRDLQDALAERLIGPDEWDVVKGDPDKINAAVRKRIGLVNAIPAELEPEKRAKIAGSRQAVNLLIAKKAGRVPEDDLDFGMDPSWADEVVDDGHEVFDLYPKLVRDETTFGDIARTLKIPLETLYEKVTGRKP